MREDKIRVLKVEPGKIPEIVILSNTLKALQAAVGGYIEVVGLDHDSVLICNEEGKLMGLPGNRRLGNDIIVGTFLITGKGNDDFCSLSDKKIAQYTSRFAKSMPFPGLGRSTQQESHILK